MPMRWIRMLVLAFSICLVIAACGDTGPSQFQGGTGSSPGINQPTADTSANQVTPEAVQDTPTAAASSGSAEIPGFPWQGSYNENSPTFTVHSKLALSWQCDPNKNQMQPFTIQVYDDDANSPAGQQVMDTSSCTGQQVIDFGGRSFTGHLMVTALGNWTIDAATYTS